MCPVNVDAEGFCFVLRLHTFELLMLEILAVGSFSTGHGDNVLGLMEVGRTWNCLWYDVLLNPSNFCMSVNYCAITKRSIDHSLDLSFNFLKLQLLEFITLRYNRYSQSLTLSPYSSSPYEKPSSPKITTFSVDLHPWRYIFTTEYLAVLFTLYSARTSRNINWLVVSLSIMSLESRKYPVRHAF